MFYTLIKHRFLANQSMLILQDLNFTIWPKSDAKKEPNFLKIDNLLTVLFRIGTTNFNFPWLLLLAILGGGGGRGRQGWYSGESVHLPSIWSTFDWIRIEVKWSLVPIYTLWGREALWELSVLPKNTTQCPRPGLEPRPLTMESSALTMRLLHLPLEDLHENQLLLIGLPL